MASSSKTTCSESHSDQSLGHTSLFSAFCSFSIRRHPHPREALGGMMGEEGQGRAREHGGGGAITLVEPSLAAWQVLGSFPGSLCSVERDKGVWL